VTATTPTTRTGATVTAARLAAPLEVPGLVVVDDDVVPDATLAALRRGIASSRLLGSSQLAGGFSATRGFGVACHARAVDAAVARVPILGPFVDLALDDALLARLLRPGVLERAALAIFGAVNALYLNVLVVPPGVWNGFKGMTDADFRWRYRRVRMQHSVRELFVREPKRKHSSADKHGDTHPRMELAVAYELLSQVLMQEHQREQAGYCAMRALMLGCSIGTLSPVVGRAYASLCLIESAAEKSSAWTVRRYKRKALETCEQSGELGQLSYTFLAAGVLDAGQARWEMATDNLKRSASYSKQLHDDRQWEQAICHHAHLEYYRGNFIRSKELYEEALASAERRLASRQPAVPPPMIT
jgi:hypothetical protein